MIKQTADITVIEVEKRSQDHAYHGCFRVKLNRQDFEKALKPEYWPCGWSVRQYFHARKKPDIAAKQRTPTKEKAANSGNVVTITSPNGNTVKKTVNSIELSNSFSSLPTGSA